MLKSSMIFFLSFSLLKFIISISQYSSDFQQEEHNTFPKLPIFDTYGFVQVRRNQPPMTVDCFKRNLSGTNGGQDFDPEMLDMMYNAIKTDEIVMPAEQTGLVKENYLWKVGIARQYFGNHLLLETL